MKAKGKEVFTLQIERMDEYGEYEVVDEMKYAKTYYSFDDAVEDGKKAYDEYSAIEDTPISVSIMGGEYEMPNGDIYGEPEGLEIIRAENRDKFDESTQRKTKMKKLNITKERFEKSRYFQKKYGKLEYVSESGKLFKTNKGNVLMFNESDPVSTQFSDAHFYKVGETVVYLDPETDEEIYGKITYAPDYDTELDEPADICYVMQSEDGDEIEVYGDELDWSGPTWQKKVQNLKRAADAKKGRKNKFKESTKKFGKKFNESNGLEWLKSFKQAQDFVDKACKQLEVVAFEGGTDVGNPIHKRLLSIWSEMRDVIESV